MDKALISVVMPAYNAEKHIAESITSVINQTWPNWELIIIDDGSTDQTAAVVQPFLSDARIAYRYQPNAKQGVARNTGLAASNGRFIAFLDSDDLWLPQMLETMLAEFNRGTQDLLFADAYTFTEIFTIGGNPPDQPRFNIKPAVYEGAAGLREFLEYNRIPMLTTLIKKEIFDNIGPFSNRGICEDYEMWLRLLLGGGKIRSIATPLAAYRIHAGSTTKNDRLAVDDCIDVIYGLSKQINNPENKKMLIAGLETWRRRKLDNIFNNHESPVFPD
jgi:teichuronic acid biosynthesis glycosyltransferase TuaG